LGDQKNYRSRDGGTIWKKRHGWSVASSSPVSAGVAVR
jgi:hypothetical protein